MNTCPCCGKPYVSNLTVSLDTNEVAIDGTTIKLGAGEAEVLSVLVEKAPGVVPMNDMLNRIYGRTERGTPMTLQVYICRINKKLKDFGFRVINKYRVGYRLAELR